MSMDRTNLFPSVTDYLEAVVNPAGRLATLTGIAAVTDREGEPQYAAGSGRVTFRVTREGAPGELTCFTTAAGWAGAGRYGEVLEQEIYVFRHDGQGAYYPVAWRPQSEPEAGEACAACGMAGGRCTLGELCEGLRLVVRQGRFGFEDEEGRTVVEARYLWADDFSEGRAPVAIRAAVGEGMAMGLIDREGRLVIEAEYDDLSWDGSRYAYVDRGGLHGCLDRTGRTVVPLEYDGMGEFDHGFAVVWREGRYGYVDERGELVGEGLAYSEAWSAEADGTARVLRPEAKPEAWERVRLRPRIESCGACE